jgi:hypothetical protein
MKLLKAFKSSVQILNIGSLIFVAGCTSENASVQSANLPANYYAVVSGAQSNVTLTLSMVSALKSALSSISASDPNAAALISMLSDSYALPDLQIELDIILSNKNLNPSVRERLTQIYQALFQNSPAGGNSIRRVVGGDGGGLFNELERFLLNHDPGQLAAVQLILGRLENPLKDLLGILNDIIADLAKPPADPNPPVAPDCSPPLNLPDTSCSEYEGYANCLSQKNLAACQATCVSQPGWYINVCQPITAPPLTVPECKLGSGESVGQIYPVTGYVCSRQHYRRRSFGSDNCPAGALDPNSPTTSCADLDALKDCLEADKQCPPGKIPVEQWVSGVHVTCTEADGSIGSRPYGHWVCKDVGTPSPPPPATPGDGQAI